MGLLRTGSTKDDGLKIDIFGVENLVKMVLKTKMERGWNGGNVHECVCVCVSRIVGAGFVWSVGEK